MIGLIWHTATSAPSAHIRRPKLSRRDEHHHGAAWAASGGIRHGRAGRVDWRVVAWMTPPSVVGSVARIRPCRQPLFVTTPPCSREERAPTSSCGRSRGHPQREAELPCPPSSGGLIGALGAIGVILGTLRVDGLNAVGLTAARVVGTNLVVGSFLAARVRPRRARRGRVGVAGGPSLGPFPAGVGSARATRRFSELGLRRAAWCRPDRHRDRVAVEAAVR